MKKKRTEANNEDKMCKKCEFQCANEYDLKLHTSVNHSDAKKWWQRCLQILNNNFNSERNQKKVGTGI